jgi:hypothetical protein
VSVGHWRNRLPPGKRGVYDRSDGITSIPLEPTRVLRQVVRDLETALGRGDRRAVGELSQRVADDVCASLRVPSLRVVVEGRRPSSDWGELHGLYTPGTDYRRDTVKVWMITAKRGQVVAFRTFLRTLVHELCHHLDYTFFALPDSLHSDGFYVRESGMMRRLMGEPPARSRRGSCGRAPTPGATAPVPAASLPALGR